jgi:hypothetical protein
MRMKDKFQLVVALVGSASCNPTLKTMLENFWDDRFFFSTWDNAFIDRLLLQQETLKQEGRSRSVLLLVDDVVMTSSADDQLAHLCMRGRHFNVSVIMCAVSYTNLPKRARRSLDVLLCFSCPMSGDMQVLTYEFSRQAKMARWALKNLEEHQALVLETLEKRQRLFVWKADLWTLKDVEAETQQCEEKQQLPGHTKCETKLSDDSSQERHTAPRQKYIDASEGSTQCAGASSEPSFVAAETL